MFGAPASRVAKTPGWPSVGTLRGAFEAGVPQQPHHRLAAFVPAHALGRDRRLVDPFLQALHGLAVPLLDLARTGSTSRDAAAVAAARAGHARVAAPAAAP